MNNCPAMNAWQASVIVCQLLAHIFQAVLTPRKLKYADSTSLYVTLNELYII